MTTRLIADALLYAVALGILTLWLIAAEAAVWLIRNWPATTKHKPTSRRTNQ